LTDLHWPYDVVTDEFLIREELSRFRLLIVPSLRYLGAEAREAVLEYLEQGGCLFFCGRCAVLDRNGKSHPEPHFGLLKIQATHAPRGYIKPVFPIEDERLKATEIATIEPDPSYRVLGRLIQLSVTRREGYPLEDVAYPLRETDLPVMVTGRKGKGQFAYVGYRFFQEYVNQSLPVIARTFTQLVGDFYQPAVWVEAPSVVEAVYNQLGSELRIALINSITTRPSGGGGESVGAEQRGFINIVEVIPIAGTKIRLRDRRVRRAFDLAGRELRVTVEQGTSVVTVPRLDQFDLITLKL
jgi:hypothetical protein